MFSQLLCELALLSADCAAHASSLIASCALCLSLACLRCGLWRDGSPGPSTSAEQYWTASMAQATGYSRSDLREGIHLLQALHEQCACQTPIARGAADRTPSLDRCPRRVLAVLRGAGRRPS